MSVVAMKRKAEKRGERGLAVVQRVTTRGAAYAKAQVGDLATNGQRLARGVDGQIQQYTGKRSAGWIDGASQLVGNHLWTALVFAGLALCALFILAT